MRKFNYEFSGFRIKQKISKLKYSVAILLGISKEYMKLDISIYIGVIIFGKTVFKKKYGKNQIFVYIKDADFDQNFLDTRSFVAYYKSILYECINVVA